MARDPRELLESSVELVEKVIFSICRRYACSDDEAEDFDSHVKLKLVDDNYAVLRKFEGKSSLPTYLTTVVHNLFRDYRNAKWGKWRPSAAARRMGTTAVRLDKLLTRDGLALAEAIEILRTNYGVGEPVEELEEMAARLPERTRRRFLGEEALEDLGSPEGVERVERRVVDEELGERLERAARALSAALAEQDAEDRLILKMRYEDGFTVARIARAMRVRARPLYSRFERCMKSLRASLEAQGLSREEVLELLGRDRGELRIDYQVDSERNSPDGSV